MSNQHIEYDILNGKKYKRLLRAYMDHIIDLTGSDLLEGSDIAATELTEGEALELAIFQQTK